MRGLGDFQRAQMKKVDPRMGQLFSQLRQVLDLLEDIALRPYAPPPMHQPKSPPIAAREPLDPERRAFGVNEVCKMLGIGRSSVWKAIQEKRLRRAKVGGRTLILACRAITNRIPQSRATILSGLAAMGLSRAVDSDTGSIAVWTLGPDGSVVADTAVPEPVGVFQAMDWRIAVDAGLARRIHAMRAAQLPNETGGILFGLVDIPAKCIHLVDASPAPPDSEQRPGGFVRGVRGVEELMESVRRRSAGQVRYVGEWHSHPPRSSARPSAIDGEQIDWLAALLHMDSMPALMIISADRELSVIFADQRAEPVARHDAARVGPDA